jgi:hypothetical protein
MLDPAKHTGFAANVSRQRNRAVFEIPEMLADILSRHSSK